LQVDVTILQQINGYPLQIVRRASHTIADQQRRAPTSLEVSALKTSKAAQFGGG
jgi:hypothetical protein